MPIVKDSNKRQQIRKELYTKLEAEGLSISETIKKLRKILSKSQPEFAEYVGVSVSVLRKIEQKTGNVTLETLDKIFSKFSFELVVKLKPKD
ncbi:helix-turn-helix domain-containing protein [bacterium]|nr:helix-turn-helix domain-containing protein [bacterium]